MNKYLILIFSFLFLILFSFSSIGKKETQQGINHQTFGLYQNGIYGISGGVMKYDSYSMGIQLNTGYRYKYDIYLVSRTMGVNNMYRSTSLYGINVFVNNQNITIAQFPYGFNITATVQGTIIYQWETNDPMPQFNVTWKNLQ